MNDKEVMQRKYALAKSGGVCEVCCKPLYDGHQQGAHRIGNTQANRKKYGDFIIDHPFNIAIVCSLKCNASCDISMNEHACLKLIKKIIERELMKFR